MPVRLKLYTRTGCHLCEDMELAVAEQAEQLNLQIEIIPIDNNPDMEKAYGSRVPVLAHEDTVICEYFLDLVALNEAVDRYTA